MLGVTDYGAIEDRNSLGVSPGAEEVVASADSPLYDASGTDYHPRQQLCRCAVYIHVVLKYFQNLRLCRKF